MFSAVAASVLATTGPGLASATTTAEPTDRGARPLPPTVSQQAVALQSAGQPSRLLQTGSRGQQVRELQRVLNEWYRGMPALAKDGIYGPETEARVRYLQERAGIAVDGIAGPVTLGVLNMSAVGGAPAPRAAADTDDSDDSAATETVPQAVAPGDFVKPTTGELTSGFGSRWGSSHNGIDIANDIGTPIYSTAAGEVVESGPAGGFGKWVRVQHDNGTISVYGHIHEALVSEGEQVAAGEQIATMGNRGQSTGPHLHFEIWQDGGDKIDPLSWLQDHGISF